MKVVGSVTTKLAVIAAAALCCASGAFARDGAVVVESAKHGIRAYKVGADLRPLLERYSLKAGVYDRGDSEGIDPKFRSMPFLLYAPKKRFGKIPLVMYFGGSGEQGDDLGRQFHQHTIFTKITSDEFQSRHPCYLFAPMLPKGGQIWNGKPETPSRLAELVNETLVAVIRQCGQNAVDTDRIYTTGLSAGGNASFSMMFSYPGRFAAAVPVACLELPGLVPSKKPGNYWAIRNENEMRIPDVLKLMTELQETVTSRGGEMKITTYPASGHNAWDAAWSEDAVWDWMFSKTASGKPPKGAVKTKTPTIATIAPQSAPVAAISCTASIPGAADRNAPGMASDGLDGTAYVSASEASKSDWFLFTFSEPVKGRVVVRSGTQKGEMRIASGFVETSVNGTIWTRSGDFSKSAGDCSINVMYPIRYLRVRPSQKAPAAFAIREIVISGK